MQWEVDQTLRCRVKSKQLFSGRTFTTSHNFTPNAMPCSMLSDCKRSLVQLYFQSFHLHCGSILQTQRPCTHRASYQPKAIVRDIVKSQMTRFNEIYFRQTDLHNAVSTSDIKAFPGSFSWSH